MTKAEQVTVKQVNQKVDDLIGRFDRMISNMKWTVGAMLAFLTLVATIVGMVVGHKG